MKSAPVPEKMYAPCGQPGALQRFRYDRRGRQKDALIASIAASGVQPEDYRVLVCAGDQDIACEALEPMVRELLTRPPWFTLCDMPGEGNLCYRLMPGGYRTCDDCFEYLWLMLPCLFKL